jgi:hypothetical protein
MDVIPRLSIFLAFELPEDDAALAELQGIAESAGCSVAEIWPKAAHSVIHNWLQPNDEGESELSVWLEVLTQRKLRVEPMDFGQIRVQDSMLPAVELEPGKVFEADGTVAKDVIDNATVVGALGRLLRARLRARQACVVQPFAKKR